MVEKVIIASRNPAKIKAVKMGFENLLPERKFEYIGVSVPSGVREQPMSNDETLKGALMRVENAQGEFEKAGFWVGIEGGIQERGESMEAFAWIIIKSQTRVGRSKTATFELPPKVVELIRAGRELGEADDIVFGRSNSKQKNGAVGILTGDVIDRISYYSEAVILALIPFKNPDLFS